MSKNSKTLVPEAKEAMNRFKMEAANEARREPQARLQRRHHCKAGWFRRRSDG